MGRIYREPSEETKEKQSKQKLGNKNPNFGKERTDAVKQAISKKLKEYWANLPSKNQNDENDETV